MKMETWKRTWWLGLLIVLAILVEYVWRQHEPGAGMISLAIACLGIAGTWQGVKRFTEWKPKELAEAEVIRNGGNDASDAASRRADDEFGAEFAGT